MRFWSRWRHLALPLAAGSFLLGLAVFFGAPPAPPARGERVRIACLPNLTHAPALIGLARGEFERALPQGVSVDPKLFNAGPESMEALLAGEVDIAYVGPSPAVNTFLKTRGRGVRLLAGASSGGAALLALPVAGIRRLEDLDGRRLAVPQLGNTQDVSARHFLARAGLSPREKGGTVEILPVRPADMLALLPRGQLDAVWAPEPWASRFVHELGALRVNDERELWPDGRFATTVVVARREYLERRPERVDAVLGAHLDVLAWIEAHPAEARRVANAELARLTGKPLPEAVLSDAWRRVDFSADPLPDSVRAFARAAEVAGYVPGGSDLAALFDPAPLQRARRLAAAPGGRP